MAVNTYAAMVKKARTFAIRAHGGQKRKYTLEPYWRHPERVAQRVAEVHPKDAPLIAAAMLHDVLEDTPTTFGDLVAAFGYEIASLVREVTDVPCEKGNRAARKALDRERLANASSRAQTLKLADLIDNTESIVKYDPGFARTYIKEKARLLEVLTRGHRKLRKQAAQMVDDAFRALDF